MRRLWCFTAMEICAVLMVAATIIGVDTVQRCKNYRADIVFMLDVSSSVSHPEFKQQLEFMVKIAKRYPIGPKDVKIGTITYADDARVPFHLKDYVWKHRLINAIRNIRQRGGDTDTAEAIRVARVFNFLEEKGARGGKVPKIGVLITDGMSHNTRALRDEAEKCIEEGITLMAIGVGLKFKNHLRRITKNSNHIFHANSFDGLNDLAIDLDKEIQPIACEEEISDTVNDASKDWRSDWVDYRFASRANRRGIEVMTRSNLGSEMEYRSSSVDRNVRNDGANKETETEWAQLGETKSGLPQEAAARTISDGEPRCTIAKADILFIMDESSSIWPEYFKVQMEFASRVVNAFNVHPDAIRVAAITFSTKARVQFNFKDHSSKNDVIEALLGAKQTIGVTSTWEALKLARTFCFRRDQGSRGPEVLKIGIVITDGNSQETYWTLDEASLLKSTGVKLFAIGVGKNVSDFELENVASGKDFILTVANYDKLLDISSEMIWKACGAKFREHSIVNNIARKDCRIRNGTSVSFLLDMESSENLDRQQTMDFIKEIIASIPVEREHLQVSILSRKCGTLPNFYSRQYKNTDELLQTLASSQSDDLTTLLLRSRLQNEKTNPNRNLETIIVVTDHAPKHKIKSVREALLLRRGGSELFVIGVGGDTDESNLRLVASVPHDRHVFLAPGYQFLQYHKNEIINGICQGLST